MLPGAGMLNPSENTAGDAAAVAGILTKMVHAPGIIDVEKRGVQNGTTIQFESQNGATIQFESQRHDIDI